MTITPSAHVGAVRCESGYLVMGDPGYTWNNFLPEAVNGFYIDPEFADPEGALGNRPLIETGVHQDIMGGVVFRAPVGVHPVVTRTDSAGCTASVTVRFDGNTDPLPLQDDEALTLGLAVDSASMAFHDPALTLTGEGGPHFDSWGDIIDRRNEIFASVDEVTGARPTVADPDGTGVMAVTSTGWGDGIYDVVPHYRDDKLIGVTAVFADEDELDD